jgi:CAAX protease family protein
MSSEGEPPGDDHQRGAPAWRRRLRWVVLGRHGLRAGWGVLLFLVLVGLIQLALVLALAAFGVHRGDVVGDPNSPQGTIAVTAMGLIGVAGATVLMMLIERRPPSDYFLGPRGLVLRFALGLVAGAATMALLAGALMAAGVLRVDRIETRPEALAASGLLWAAAYLLVALFEELFLRGYLLAKLARSLGFRVAAVGTSVLFAAGHIANAGESPIGLVSVVLIGLVLAYSVWKTGSLWWAIGFHAAWNWSETFVFGVANSGFPAQGSVLITHPAGPAWLSGGMTGPEGSLANLAAIAVGAAIVRWASPRRTGEIRAEGRPV